MIKLFRTGTWYRPLSIMVESKNSINNYELNNILFFDENGIIIQIGSGFFDDDKEREFNGTCVRKLKIDFSMKDNFIVKAEKNLFNETKYDLYIYKGNADIICLGKGQKYFGEIYSHWKINDYEHWKYEKSLKNELNKLNDRAEQIAKSIADKYGYMKTGIEENILNDRMKMLKEINTQILQEVENIKNYKIDE